MLHYLTNLVKRKNKHTELSTLKGMMSRRYAVHALIFHFLIFIALENDLSVNKDRFFRHASFIRSQLYPQMIPLL